MGSSSTPAGPLLRVPRIGWLPPPPLLLFLLLWLPGGQALDADQDPALIRHRFRGEQWPRGAGPYPLLSLSASSSPAAQHANLHPSASGAAAIVTDGNLNFAPFPWPVRGLSWIWFNSSGCVASTSCMITLLLTNNQTSMDSKDSAYIFTLGFSTHGVTGLIQAPPSQLRVNFPADTTVFWVSWLGGEVFLGAGNNPESGLTFGNLTDPSPRQVTWAAINSGNSPTPVTFWVGYPDNPTCGQSNYVCPSGFTALNATTICSALPCNQSDCCVGNPTCGNSSVTCTSGFTPSSAGTVCSSLTCNSTDCCIANPTCGSSSYPCPSHYSPHDASTVC
eukprot:RCo003070